MFHTDCSKRSTNSAVHHKYTSPVLRTRYGLDDPEIEPRWRSNFVYPSRPAPSPTQPPVQWMPGVFHGGKAAGDHLVCYMIASQHKHEQTKSTRCTIWNSVFNAFKTAYKGKASHAQAWTGPEGSGRMRLPAFRTIGT